MSFREDIIKYMICFLCVVAICVIFSDLLKRFLKIAVRGALGLGTVKVLNFFLSSMGLALGINPINGAVIGILGLPALIGLYIIKFFTL